MVSVFTHGASAVAIGALFPPAVLPRRAWIAGALLAVAPDLDILLHWSGVPYWHLFGHRGFSHSPCCALLVAGLVTLALRLRRRPRAGSGMALFAYLALCMASHGLLDALTSGGLGVAFLAPFSAERFFLPWTPIKVAPLSVSGFFTGRGLEVFTSELCWAWLPGAVVAGTAMLLRAARAGQRSSTMRRP